MCLVKKCVKFLSCLMYVVDSDISLRLHNYNVRIWVFIIIFQLSILNSKIWVQLRKKKSMDHTCSHVARLHHVIMFSCGDTVSSLKVIQGRALITCPIKFHFEKIKWLNLKIGRFILDRPIVHDDKMKHNADQMTHNADQMSHGTDGSTHLTDWMIQIVYWRHTWPVNF